MTLDEILLHLTVDGFCVVEDVIPEPEVDAIRKSALASFAASKVKPPYKNSSGESDDHAGFINVDQSIAPYLADERVMAIVEAVFGPHVRAHETLLIVRRPLPEVKERRSSFHLDGPFAPCFAGHFRRPFPDTVVTLRAFWFLTPFTQENGATFVVPGSHRMHTLPHIEGLDVNTRATYPTEVQAVGKAGSLMLWDTRLWHTTGINHSDEDRVFMSMAYVPWWFNLEPDRDGSVQNQYMLNQNGQVKRGVPLIPEDVYQSLPEKAKPLFLHWVEER